VWAPVVAFAAFACASPPLMTPTPVPVQQTPVNVAQNVKNKVDILFMVDNSNSMSAMSNELKNRFGQFFKVFQDLAMAGTNADLQIGVVTSDYGAGATGAPGCQIQPGGQQGRLQSMPSAYAVMNDATLANCKPPSGANFIKYDFGNTGNANLPAGQDLVTTFTCMASVGAGGCGFEYQMESVYAALHGNIPDNAGFLRDDALLAIVFLTNEDDASAPETTDVFDKTKVSQYGYEDSYSRQTRFAIVCGDMGMFPPYADSGGPLAACKSAPNPGDAGPGKQYDIQRYIDFFTKPLLQGGIKNDPSDVILVGIDAPAEPFQVILSNPGTPGGTPYSQCGQLNETSNPPCVPVLQHSCQDPSQPVFFGDPAVRLNTVISLAMNHDLESICATDYTPAMQKIGGLIVSAIGGGCIPSCVVDVNNMPNTMTPDCAVQVATVDNTGVTTTTVLTQCNGNNMFPCWQLDVKTTCAATSPQSAGITVNWGPGGTAPPSTTAKVFCSTIPGAC
jgi:hypothetical protein